MTSTLKPLPAPPDAGASLTVLPGAAAGAPTTLTPYLDLDVRAAVARYRRLAAALPGTAVHYAVRANPEPALLHALAANGCRFGVASPAEVVAVLKAGAAPADLVYSDPVKRRSDIAFAARLGVRILFVDSLEETEKVAAAAPGSSVLCRILTSGQGSDWPLSRKNGCATHEAVQVLRVAAAAGLDPAGVSFHVGSQQRDPQAWDPPVAAAALVFDALHADGLRPWLLDLGGGFPANHDGGAPPLACYGAAIELQLRRHFGPRRPQTVIGPGRAVVADAGTLVSTVLAVVHHGPTRWVFLDVGVCTGLVETLDEGTRYRLRTSADGGPTGPCWLAGPTCDGADVLHENVSAELPITLAEGDTVRLLSTGAYTSAYSTVGFNGFARLATRLV